MKLITRQSLATEVAQRWKEQYFSSTHGWSELFLRNARDIHIKLKSLGPTPNPDDVDSAIGTSGWTTLRCDECREIVERAVQLGQEPDYESSTAIVCQECITRAVLLVTESKQ